MNTFKNPQVTSKRLALAFLCLALALPLCACGGKLGALLSATPEPAALDLSNTNLTDVTSLLEKTNLASLDLRGNPISIESYETLATALPDCDILWSVPIGDERVDSDTAELALESLPEDVNALLAYFPNLKTVSIAVSDESNYSALMSLAAAYPAVEFTWNVAFEGETYSSSLTSLDLSGKTVTAAELTAALAGLPALKSVAFDETAVFSTEEQLALVEAYPAVSFVWTVQLLDDLSVRSDVAELDLRDYTVPDAAAFSDKLQLLNALTRLDMCGCGPTDDEMAAMRARYPAIKFIWLTQVSKWMIRTDIQGFSTGNKRKFPDDMGYYIGKDFEYGNIHAEDFENLKYCTDLIALDVGHCDNIGNIDFIANLPKLKYLIISLCNLTDISALENQTDLEFLEMTYNYLTDISPIRNCKKLRFLNLSANSVTSIDVYMELPNLERLWINGNHLTEEQVATLQAALPDTLIKAHPTSNEYALSLWRKGNEGYLTIQKMFGLRAQHQGSVTTGDDG
ncbi:MAG TPA: leucine-rich repeat domain-containing protein [Feifaniaceae bacterium]|nr:leucine-rich repeat domain-containing protein [Feifaniaceae bacterium]